MKKMHFILPLAAALIFALSSLVAAAPLRLAQAPVISQAYCPEDTWQALEKKVDRATHVPLNGYLKAIEYIPPKEILQAWDTLRLETGRKTRPKDLIRPLAEKLQADMVVLPVLTGYQEFHRMSWRRGLIYHCYASVDLYVYDARTDEVIKKSASRFFDDESSNRGTAYNLALQAMDAVLQESRLHERIYPSHAKEAKAAATKETVARPDK
jgi:hypothetical protein